MQDTAVGLLAGAIRDELHLDSGADVASDAVGGPRRRRSGEGHRPTDAVSARWAHRFQRIPVSQEMSARTDRSTGTDTVTGSQNGSATPVSAMSV